MKQFRTQLKRFLLVAIAVVVSCVGVDDNYIHYLEEGEILYTTKIDSVYSLSGNGRIQLSAFVTNAFSVDEFVVSYNRGENSLSFPFTKNDQKTQRIDMIVPDLDERTYEMTLVTKDKENNTSVSTRTFATSYGENYRKNLTPRSTKNVIFDGTNGRVVWNPSSSLGRRSSIKFTNTEGQEVVVEASRLETETLLPNLNPNETIEYLSAYVPTSYDRQRNMETSIDEFETDWTELSLPTELTPLLQTITLTPGVDGTTVHWVNDDKLELVVTAIFVDSGEEQRVSVTTSDEMGTLNVGGLTNGQDFNILISNASGNGLGAVFQAKALNRFPSDQIKRILLPTDESGEHFGGSVEFLFDGTARYYHSIGETPEQFGHHFTLDFGRSITLKGIKIWPRVECCQERNIKRYQLWGINDLSNAETTLVSHDSGWEEESKAKGWTLIHDSETPNIFKGVTSPHTEKIDAQKAFRYVRYRAVTNHASHKRTALAEIAFYIE